MRFEMSRGWATHAGGSSAHASLKVTQATGQLLRLHGYIRPGRYNLLLKVPVTIMAAVFVLFGLLLMITRLDAIGLVLVGAFLGALVPVVRSVESSWIREVAAELSAEDGWLVTTLGEAGRQREGDSAGPRQ